MKKIVSVIFITVIALIVAAGCNSQGYVLQEGKVNVITSFFPLYDFAREIGGEHVNVVNIIPTGVDPHDWTPKSQDMTNVANAQMFIYQGAGFEGWTEDLLAGIDKGNLVVVEASHGIELLTASPEGEEHAEEHAEEGEEHADEHAKEGEAHADEHAAEESGEDEHDHGQFDPHTWLSPRSALAMAENIKNGLVQADPEHTADYEKNYEALTAELKALDDKFKQQLSGAAKKEIVVSHQAFGYLARDYGLSQLPIMGLAHEAEPTAQDLKEISEFVKEHEVRYIFTEELLSDELAKTLANDLGVQTLPLNPVEGLTEEQMKAGETYISLMEDNLANLMTALK
ncbi:metal ABC transporter substrate-binding protein [Paenibacillus alkalitolerans]|uniref:metal ABC transporter substrate-binding protein n=1 Tax=Paenibacillus alkalitolerans TaxID=2799335 RepID=UPI0018F446CB|nr:metal ABC transporter substrate-binding protein [Paenibacillus alkalitolerans]